MLKNNRRSMPATSTLMSVVLCFFVMTIAVGCRSYSNLSETVCNDTTCVDALMCEVDAGAPPEHIPEIPAEPLTLRSPEAFDTANYRELSLQEAIQIALSNSQVLRDLGAFCPAG